MDGCWLAGDNYLGLLYVLCEPHTRIVHIPAYVAVYRYFAFLPVQLLLMLG